MLSNQCLVTLFLLISISASLLSSPVVAQQNAAARPSLRGVHTMKKSFTQIAKETLTDKVGIHDYGWFYDYHLKDIRHDKFTMVEIGFALGRGAKAWKTFLPNARVVGMEVGCTKENAPENDWITNSDYFKEFSREGNLICMSALDFVKADELLKSFTSPFQVMIEDGGHSDMEMVLSFFYYFPRLASEGIFFSEDIGVAYVSMKNRYENKNIISAVIEPLIDTVNYDKISAKLNVNNKLNIFNDIVKQVSCSQGICMIQRNSNVPSQEALDYYKTVWKSSKYHEPLNA